MANPEKSNLRVSAVIPAYNAVSHIVRSIDSILNQSCPADEIIVVDDGSTDGTAEIVKGYGDKVRYVYQENAGASVARNTGIKNATCDWIAFLDGDDEWHSDYLECQVDLIERNPEIVWTTANFYECSCGGEHKQQLHDKGAGSEFLNGKDVYDDYFDAYIIGAAGWTGTMMIKRDALEEAGLFTPGLPMGNDVDMWYRIAYRWPRIGYNTKPLAVYHSDVTESITKKQRDPNLLCNLIARHLEISKAESAYDRFKPCAVHMVKYWNYQYIFDDRASNVLGITKRFSGILKLHYRIIIRLLTIFPAMTMAGKPLIDKASWRLGLRR